VAEPAAKLFEFTVNDAANANTAPNTTTPKIPTITRRFTRLSAFAQRGSAYVAQRGEGQHSSDRLCIEPT
jgi:hypothetical protein